MGVIRGSLLFVITIVMSICVILMIMSLSMYHLLYPNIYISSLRGSGAFDYAEEQLQQSGPTSFIKIPEGGVEVLFSGLVTNFLSYARSDTDTLNLSVQVDQPKLRAFFLSGIKNVSVCAPGKKPDYDNLEKLCKPKNMSADEFLDDFTVNKNLTFFQHDVVDLVPVYGLEEGSEGRERLDNLRKYVSYARYAIMILGVMILILIGTILIIDHNYLRQFMRWAGAPFLVVGSAVFAGVMMVGSYAAKAIALIEEPLLADLAMSFLHVISIKFYFYSGITFAIGLLLIVGSFFLRKRTEMKKRKG